MTGDQFAGVLTVCLLAALVLYCIAFGRR